MLIQEPPAGLQSDHLTAKPAEPAPDGGVIEHAFVDCMCRGGLFVGDGHGAGTNDISITAMIVLDVVLGKFEQIGSGVAFIGENESRGSP